MIEIDVTAPGIERLVSHDAPLDLIANDLTFAVIRADVEKWARIIQKTGVGAN